MVRSGWGAVGGERRGWLQSRRSNFHYKFCGVLLVVVEWGGGEAMVCRGDLDGCSGSGVWSDGQGGGLDPRIRDGFWEKAGMDWWVSKDGNASIGPLWFPVLIYSLICFYFFAQNGWLQRRANPELQHECLEDCYWNQLGREKKINLWINPVPPAKSIVFQLGHSGFIESKHLNSLQNSFETRNESQKPALFRNWQDNTTLTAVSRLLTMDFGNVFDIARSITTSRQNWYNQIEGDSGANMVDFKQMRIRCCNDRCVLNVKSGPNVSI